MEKIINKLKEAKENFPAMGFDEEFVRGFNKAFQMSIFIVQELSKPSSEHPHPVEPKQDLNQAFEKGDLLYIEPKSEQQVAEAERNYWMGWLKKRIEIPEFQWQYISFALSELQQENKELKLKSSQATERIKELEEENKAASDVISAWFAFAGKNYKAGTTEVNILHSKISVWEKLKGTKDGRVSEL